MTFSNSSYLSSADEENVFSSSLEQSLTRFIGAMSIFPNSLVHVHDFPVDRALVLFLCVTSVSEDWP